VCAQKSISSNELFFVGEWRLSPSIKRYSTMIIVASDERLCSINHRQTIKLADSAGETTDDDLCPDIFFSFAESRTIKMPSLIENRLIINLIFRKVK
jgi:hypothetical protein